MPVPLAPLFTPSHDDPSFDAVHEQPSVAVTVPAPEPPDEPKLCDVGDTVNEHVAAACVTVTACPLTVTVPVRGDVEVFGAATRPIAPLPEPLPPEAIVSHVAVVDAVQVHPLAAVTPIDAEPPPTGTDCDEGDSV